GDTTGARTGPKGVIKIGWTLEPDTLNPKFLSGRGAAGYHWIFNAPLANRDVSGVPFPMLAERLPSQANGDLVVRPNGTMLTTYRLRAGATWHDGAPVTAADFVFAFEVYTDADIPVENPQPEPLMERVEALDDRTLTITWKTTYVDANALGNQQLNPLPRHVHETKYRANKASFLTGDEWSTAYVGTGPFKVESWTPGSQLIARAHLGFALGPPKLDIVVIRIITDPNTQLANLLAGEVDLINSPDVLAPEAAVARERWATTGEGYVKTWATQTTFMEFQFREVPNWQRAVADVRVRRALLHAMDRQGIDDIVNLGFLGTADAFISPTDPLFPEVDRTIAKYPYDPNRAIALLADAGWVRPSGDGPALNAAGQPLQVDIATGSISQPIATVAADNWRAAGVTPGIFVIPVARSRDSELRTSFPGTALNQRSLGPDQFVWTSEQSPTPENRYIGSNRGSFFDPETDRLQGMIMTSLDAAQRRDAIVAQARRMTETVGVAPLIHPVAVILARKNVVGPIGGYSSGLTWNVHEWEMQ
ncbi:MAG: hypothetical protein HW416_3427, partial [Chloroflexi bacterium]|nr:hypothetical protein [Chloroflexota bacterium]